MIRAILHLHGEQPLTADLEALPEATATVVMCSNLRQSNGRRPEFVEDTQSTFLFPIATIRFVEIVVTDLAAERPVAVAVAPAPASNDASHSEDDEIDPELLRRLRDL